MGYELESWGSIPGRGKRFSLLHSVQTGSGIHPASYSMGTGALSPGIKWPGMELTTHPHLVLKLRIVELYLHSLTCLHGIVLNYLSTLVALPFYTAYDTIFIGSTDLNFKP
jgi:hypothetical protein